jgi:chromosome partitioning protein
VAKIICPKCGKEHEVDENKLKKKFLLKKRFIARCKVCNNRFPVQSEEYETDTSSPKEGFRYKSKSARKICITLSKGGVGKTTTSVNLSAGLALAGHKVLLIDTDTQGQCAYILGENPKVGLTELLTGELPADEVVVQSRENLDLIGGGKSLAGIKRMITRKSFGGEWTLSEAMKEFDHKYDYVIIDTSPGWDQLTVNVLFYASEVLVPMALEFMPLHGLAEFIKRLGSIQQYRKEIALKYILPTFMDARVKGPQQIFTRIKKLYPEYICKPIGYSENLSEAPSYGKTIFEFAPGCNASIDYRELVRRVARDNSLLL